VDNLRNEEVTGDDKGDDVDQEEGKKGDGFQAIA